MSEQSKRPATTSKSSDSDSVPKDKAAETSNGTPAHNNAGKSGQVGSAADLTGTQGQDRKAGEAAGSSLDIPSLGTSRRAEVDREATPAQDAREEAVEKGLFDISEVTFPEAMGKGASADGSGKAGNSARKAKRRTSATEAKSTKKSPTRRPAKTKADGPAANVDKDTDEIGEDISGKRAEAARTGRSRVQTDRKKTTASGKKAAESTDSDGNTIIDAQRKDAGKAPRKPLDKTSAKISAGQKPGARISSGGDPTIERKAALTTTTPIRKRKADGGGGTAVLIALLVVVAAAGYYVLTQTGIVGPDRNEQLASTAETLSEEGTSNESAVTGTSEQQTTRKTPDAAPTTSDSADPVEAGDTPGGVLTTAAGKSSASASPTSTTDSENSSGSNTGSGLGEIPKAPPAPVLPEAPKSVEPTAETPGDTNPDAAQVPTTLAKRDPKADPTKQAMTPAVLNDEGLREIEELLMRLQIDPGPTDGVIDNRTVTAIRLYQEIAGLPVNGQPSPGLLVELREVVELLSND